MAKSKNLPAIRATVHAIAATKMTAMMAVAAPAVILPLSATRFQRNFHTEESGAKSTIGPAGW